MRKRTVVTAALWRSQAKYMYASVNSYISRTNAAGMSPLYCCEVEI